MSFSALLLAGSLVLPQSTGPGEAGPARTDPAQAIPLSLRVNHAIALGVEHLKELQQADGNWGGYSGQHPGGATAFVTFTLLRSGVRRDDPAVTRGLAALEGVEFRSVYSAAAHLLLLDSLRDPALREQARPSLDFLLVNREKGVWAYPWGHLCNSNTQFALLALRAARHMGLEVPDGVWMEALEGLSLFRNTEGGYVYSPELRESYAGMTAATLASFAVLREVAAEVPRLRTALDRQAKAYAGAESWLERRFEAGRNVCDDFSWRSAFQCPYLWAVERWCGLTGRERIGPHDWYTEGAEWLLEVQEPDGAFGREGGMENTCFALLFLRRATVSGGDELVALDAELERQRASRPRVPRRPGESARRMTEWWLAGPWVQSGNEPLLLDPPFDPAEARPRERAKIGRREWQQVELEGDQWTDLEVLAGHEGNRQLWVLSTWLEVEPLPEPEETLEVRLWFEFQDGWDVWLDGERLSRERRRSLTAIPDVSFALGLGAGLHSLTVLVEDRQGPCPFGALLGGVRGGPPPAGLQVRATPPSERAGK